jgi:copper chaperone CopZ
MTRERVFQVPKIKCEGCVETIEKALAGVPGVTAARVGIVEKEVRVEFDPARTDDERLRRALGDAGFPPA